jgi:hypothetical protein
MRSLSQPAATCAAAARTATTPEYKPSVGDLRTAVRALDLHRANPAVLEPLLSKPVSWRRSARSLFDAIEQITDSDAKPAREAHKSSKPRLPLTPFEKTNLGPMQPASIA